MTLVAKLICIQILNMTSQWIDAWQFRWQHFVTSLLHGVVSIQLMRLLKFFMMTTTDKRTDACSWPLCYALKFLAYKKKTKTWKKEFPPPKKKFHSSAHSPQPRIDFSYHKMSGTSVCSLICDDYEAHWVKSHTWLEPQWNL